MLGKCQRRKLPTTKEFLHAAIIEWYDLLEMLKIICLRAVIL